MKLVFESVRCVRTRVQIRSYHGLCRETKNIKYPFDYGVGFSGVVVQSLVELCDYLIAQGWAMPIKVAIVRVIYLFRGEM